MPGGGIGGLNVSGGGSGIGISGVVVVPELMGIVLLLADMPLLMLTLSISTSETRSPKLTLSYAEKSRYFEASNPYPCSYQQTLMQQTRLI